MTQIRTLQTFSIQIDLCMEFPYNCGFSANERTRLFAKEITYQMSYAIIRTGGKQFPVETGQTLRIPAIGEKAGAKVDLEALLVGEGKDAKFAGGATVSATVVGHGKADKVIVFKKKRRKQYKRKQGHRQGFTEIKIEKI